MVDLTTANNLSDLISNQNNLLDTINKKTSAWDSKADGVKFDKLTAFFTLDPLDEKHATINGNLTVNALDATVLSASDKLKVSTTLEITASALVSSSGSFSLGADKVSINDSVSVFKNGVTVHQLLNIEKDTTITNLIFNNTISLDDTKSHVFTLQSSLNKINGAYIILTNKDYNGKPPYYDANASSFHVVTNSSNDPSFSIYNDKTAKFYNTVSIPYLEIPVTTANNSSLTFKTPSNTDWVFLAKDKSLELKSISSTASSVTLGGNIIAFERDTFSGSKYVNDIARVHFGEPIGTSNNYEITFDFAGTNPTIKMKGDPVLGTRQTGWKYSYSTGITSSDLDKDLNKINPGSSLTVESLAQVVRALAQDMINHGLIGT